MSGSPKKKAAKPRAKATHPKTIEMVVSAIKALKDAKGTSLAGVRNYIKSNYPSANTAQLNSQLRRAVKTGLASGVLVRPKGDTSIGATGRFRVGKVEKPKKKKVVKKKPVKKAKKPKKPKAKSPKKKPAAKKVKKAKSPKKKAAKPKKSPKKAKKPAAKKAKKPVKKAGAKKPKAKKVAKK